MIELCCKHLPVCWIWLCVLIMPQTRFRVFVWMSRNSLLETDSYFKQGGPWQATTECRFTPKCVCGIIITHRAIKCLTQALRKIWLRSENMQSLAIRTSPQTESLIHAVLLKWSAIICGWMSLRYTYLE